MKPQKKAAVAKKATKMPTVPKKRRTFMEKPMIDVKKEKKTKKQDKIEELKKKVDNDRKKFEKRRDGDNLDDKKKIEDKKRFDDKKKSEKTDDKKKICKDQEKKSDKSDEKKVDKYDDKCDPINEEENDNDDVEKKKLSKFDERIKTEKSEKIVDNKKKIEKSEDKKKNGKLDDESLGSIIKSINTIENSNMMEEKVEALAIKKKGKDDKKKDIKVYKLESKDGTKTQIIKDKKIDRKKVMDKDPAKIKVPPVKMKKDNKIKKPQNKIVKKAVLSKKAPFPVIKKLIDKQVKLVKVMKAVDSTVTSDDQTIKKAKKKAIINSNKVSQDKKPKLARQMKAKLTPNNKKISTILKKDDKIKNLTQKVVLKKKPESKTAEKNPDDRKIVIEKNETINKTDLSNIKSEIIEDKDLCKSEEVDIQDQSCDSKKVVKSGSKINKKIVRKSSKTTKASNENENCGSSTIDESSLDDAAKQIKISDAGTKFSVNLKQDQTDIDNNMELNLKVETINGYNSSSSSYSNSDDDDDEDYKIHKRNECRKKEKSSSPSEERSRRMRLFGFWSGPKRHRVASLNALAKVHCLYENETGGVYLGGFCKPKPEKEKSKKSKDEKEEVLRKDKEKKPENKAEETNAPKRKLRKVPGLRGKHWDMMESSSSPSSSEEDCESEKNSDKSKKKVTKRKKKNEQVMDLKDMVVCKRMASLNASAILAASYSDEKNRRDSSSSSSSSESSSDSEIEILKKRRQLDSDIERRKSRQVNDSDEVIKPSKKVVILNQDTDVTITGVYVNQTRSTHHEGFCSIAGMQYRISSTSHTQTAATAVATELRDQKTEQPCKSYTPLGALSSMQPPGSQGNHSNMSPRRHSAFSTPHQPHGYYQPAGPLIQHPSSLPPVVKGPPPEPTPTPPQNSEGSDDLVATSTTSGGTSSTAGGFYRAYCPQYYGTPPQYQELCYQPTYSHPHAHPPPYYKYPPAAYRRQYYGYQESGPGGPGAGTAGPTAGTPGVVDYQPPPPPPGEYPLPPYYAGYPPLPPPPPPNPAYLHAQGRPFVDHTAFQSCPCPMQSCPKNVDTGPLIGNGKGAPVVSGPGLSLPPSALVGPPSPARGLAGLAPPHGANAWDTDRVQLNTHRSNLSRNQTTTPPTPRSIVAGHNRPQNLECRNKDDKCCTNDKTKCGCQKDACTTSSSREVKVESLSPSSEKLLINPANGKFHRSFKFENNNVKCESCSVEVTDNITCAANCNVKCESDYKCDIIKCEDCMKGQMAIIEMDKDSGILLIDDKLDADSDVKEELNDDVVIDIESWKKPDYEPTVTENVEEKESKDTLTVVDEPPQQGEEQTQTLPIKCKKVTKRKLSLDSLSDSRKKRRKISKRTLSVGSCQDSIIADLPAKIVAPNVPLLDRVNGAINALVPKKKQNNCKKEASGCKRKAETTTNNIEVAPKKQKSMGKQATGSNHIISCLKPAASETSIMETIDDVIEQSLQITEKKDRKSKVTEKSEKKKKTEKIATAIKKVTKKVNLAKEVASDKLSKIVAKTQKPKTETKNKIKDSKPKKSKSKSADVAKVKSSQEVKNKESKKPEVKVCDEVDDVKKSALAKKNGKKKNGKKQTVSKKVNCKVEEPTIGHESLQLVRRLCLKPKWSNGWNWEGEPYEAKVYLTNEESAIRRCYDSMRHESGDVLRPLDCVLLKSGQRKADLPYVAKIASLWENPDDGEMMFSLLWYYRPEHTDQGRTEFDTEDEVFASRHKDANSVACIEDKCFILTFNEYCRYRKHMKIVEEGLENPGLIVPPGDQIYPRENRQPPIPVSSDMVLFCRRVYDYRGKKLVKNPG